MVVVCASAVRVIIGLNPNTMSMRRNQPAPIYPDPATATPVPIAIGPHIPWPRRYTHRTNHSGRRRRTPNANADVDAHASKRGRSDKRSSNRQRGSGKYSLESHNSLLAVKEARRVPKYKCLKQLNKISAKQEDFSMYPLARLRWQQMTLRGPIARTHGKCQGNQQTPGPPEWTHPDVSDGCNCKRERLGDAPCAQCCPPHGSRVN